MDGSRSDLWQWEPAVVAASDVSFVIRQGECLALVGESGSGKRRLRDVSSGYTTESGPIALEGQELGRQRKETLAGSGRRIQIVFQNPFESLNPRNRVKAPARSSSGACLQWLRSCAIPCRG